MNLYRTAQFLTRHRVLVMVLSIPLSIWSVWMSPRVHTMRASISLFVLLMLSLMCFVVALAGKRNFD